MIGTANVPYEAILLAGYKYAQFIPCVCVSGAQWMYESLLRSRAPRNVTQRKDATMPRAVFVYAAYAAYTVASDS